MPGLAGANIASPAAVRGAVVDALASVSGRGRDVIAILPGYAPSRAATEVWNYLRAPLRLVVVVSDAPPNIAAVDDLNSMGRLERVIAQMDLPSRAGFERLQRPLLFRKLME